MRILALSIALVAAFSMNAQASVTGLYNTGVDNSGNVLPYGSTDPHYTIVSSPDGGPLPEKTMDSSGGFPIPPWLGDDTLSRWDSESSDGHGGEGTGTFDNQTTFTSSVAGTVYITGQWATDDNIVGIKLNGGTLSNTGGGGFSFWTPFTIIGTVTAGTNTLDFFQGQGGTPGGVRVEIFSATTPEPASILVWGLVIGAGLVVARRRKA